MSYLKYFYLLLAAIFFVCQGPFYNFWWGFAKRDKYSEKMPHIREVLLNSLGSLVGWTIGYYFLFYRLETLLKNNNPTFPDLVLFLIAFYGMTGYLPHVLINKLKFGKE